MAKLGRTRLSFLGKDRGRSQGPALEGGVALWSLGSRTGRNPFYGRNPMTLIAGAGFAFVPTRSYLAGNNIFTSGCWRETMGGFCAFCIMCMQLILSPMAYNLGFFHFSCLIKFI